MNRHLFYGILLLILNCNCTQVNSQETASTAAPQDSVYVGKTTYFSDEFVREDALYTSIIRVDKNKVDEFVLSVQMILNNDSYFISPNAKGNFSGKFNLVLTEPDKLQASGWIVETPLSTEEMHETQGLGNFVRENTNYKQTLKVLTTENFDAAGYLQFTIEPRCTMEKIFFILSFENGRLSVKMDGC